MGTLIKNLTALAECQRYLLYLEYLGWNVLRSSSHDWKIGRDATQKIFALAKQDSTLLLSAHDHLWWFPRIPWSHIDKSVGSSEFVMISAPFAVGRKDLPRAPGIKLTLEGWSGLLSIMDRWDRLTPAMANFTDGKIIEAGGPVIIKHFQSEKEQLPCPAQI